MFKCFVVCFSVLCLCFVGWGEALKCYHCYDSYNKLLDATSFELSKDANGQFVRCDKNKNKWNSWECPAEWPVCIIMSGTVKDHYELVRSCGAENFCSKYVPPNGVKLESCRECNTTLCNDYITVPEPPPLGPGPLFNFNINIQLNLKKYPQSNEDLNEL